MKNKKSSKFPQITKSLSSFLIEEDAKVANEVSAKVALSVAAIVTGGLLSLDSVNAGGGPSSHTNHTNQVIDKSVDGIMQNDDPDHDGESNKKTFTQKGRNLDVEVPSKSVSAAHANHMNYSEDEGKT